MNEHELPLGKTVAYDAAYDPRLLFPIARAQGRARLGIGSELPFFGWDIWNAYEVSWLDLSGKPKVAWAECRVPAGSPAIVESKSFKLYLNSLNQQRFADAAAVTATVQADLSACVGVAVEVAVHEPAAWDRFAIVAPSGQCLDDLPVIIDCYHPAPELLRADTQRIVSQRLFSRLLRSRCPVTGQPDWGAVEVEYSGPEIDGAGLLAYIISFRLHQDFHEQCVERMFIDLMQRCSPHSLSVHARYLRRGGLDINPYRSTDPWRPDNLRWFQQ